MKCGLIRVDSFFEIVVLRWRMHCADVLLTLCSITVTSLNWFLVDINQIELMYCQCCLVVSCPCYNALNMSSLRAGDCGVDHRYVRQFPVRKTKFGVKHINLDFQSMQTTSELNNVYQDRGIKFKISRKRWKKVFSTTACARSNFASQLTTPHKGQETEVSAWQITALSKIKDS